MSITSCGSVVIWSDLVASSEDDSSSSSEPTSLQKEFIKSIKLSDSALQVIRSVDDFVMVSDVSGHIRFFDKELKILFWCPSHETIDFVVAISFDLKRKTVEDETTNDKSLSVRDFFVRKEVLRRFLMFVWEVLIQFLPQFTETKSDIFSVDVARMKFNRIFFKSDDFITAIEVIPTNRNLICCANYSGRIFIYDYAKKTQVVENRLKLQKATSSTSDTDTYEIPHISALAFSHDGRHLLCGLENGSVVVLDPNMLHEVKVLSVSHDRIAAIKFSLDSNFVTLYVRRFFFENCYRFVILCRRTTSRRWHCCTMTRLLTEVGVFWDELVSMPKPFAMFCSFRRTLKLHVISKLLRDWFR